MKHWIFLGLFLFAVHLNAAQQSIQKSWQNSNAYKEYVKAMESGDLKKAFDIKHKTIIKIAGVELKDYISYFKDKYEQKYLKHLSTELPPKLLDLLKDVHKKLVPYVKDKSAKEKNKYAQSLYNFMKKYYNEQGNAQKYAHKITKTSGITEENKTIKLLVAMGKESDAEAAKTPEQKKKEYDEFMKKLDKHIKEGNRKIEEADRKIEEWNEIIKKLKAL